VHQALFNRSKPVKNGEDGRVKIDLKKWIIHMPAHDGLFSQLKPNSNLGTNEHYLLPYQTG
jgi:hypothetical protein